MFYFILLLNCHWSIHGNVSVEGESMKYREYLRFPAMFQLEELHSAHPSCSMGWVPCARLLHTGIPGTFARYFLTYKCKVTFIPKGVGRMRARSSPRQQH